MKTRFLKSLIVFCAVIAVNCNAVAEVSDSITVTAKEGSTTLKTKTANLSNSTITKPTAPTTVPTPTTNPTQIDIENTANAIPISTVQIGLNGMISTVHINQSGQTEISRGSISHTSTTDETRQQQVLGETEGSTTTVNAQTTATPSGSHTATIERQKNRTTSLDTYGDKHDSNSKTTITTNGSGDVATATHFTADTVTRGGETKTVNGQTTDEDGTITIKRQKNRTTSGEDAYDLNSTTTITTNGSGASATHTSTKGQTTDEDGIITHKSDT